MRKKKVVLNQLVLGNRELGWELWSEKEVVEMTSKQIKEAIRSGEKICGLKIGTKGNLELDEEGFYTTNLMIHSHIGCWRSMREGTIANVLYVCLGSHQEGANVVYDCISSRLEQVSFREEDMKAYIKIGLLSGGAKVEGDRIVVASIEETKEKREEVEKKGTKGTKKEEQKVL